MNFLAQDVRYCLRQLKQSPLFTATVLLTLALGIGSATAVFSVVDSVLLKPFAFRDPGRLVVWRETIQEVSSRYPLLPDNYKHFLYLKAHSTKIADAAILQNASFPISAVGGHPQIVKGLSMSPNLFSLLGVEPLLGRTFLPEEAQPGSQQPVILSWAAWQNFFNADPRVIGRHIRMADKQRTVVGVLPKTFSLPQLSEMPGTAQTRQPSPYEVFEPLVPQTDDLTSDDADFSFLVIARLKPGVSTAKANAELDGMEKAYSASNHLQIHLGATVVPLSEEVTGGVKKALWLLFGSVLGVLAIACVNLAGLQLARSVAHDRENALRLALGAEHHRLLRSLMIESLILTAFGGVAGIMTAVAGVRLFIAIAPADIPRLTDIHVSSPIILFSLGLTIFTSLIFGILPGLRLLNANPQQVLQQGSNQLSGSRRSHAMRSTFVVFEVAGTVLLMIVTAVMARSLAHVLNQNRAFNADHVIAAQASLPADRYSGDESSAALARSLFVDRALERLRENPDVESAAITSNMPLSGEISVYGIHRKENPLPESKEPTANLRNISPDYFKTLQIPFLAGAPFGAEERDHPIHAIMSQNAAHATWPGENPLGRAFRINGRTYTVSGVAADARIADLKRDTPVVYLPYWHDPPSTVFFLVRSKEPQGSLAAAIRRDLWEIDPEIAIPTIESLDATIDQSVAADRFQTSLLSLFGLVALLLSLIGVYGILSYSVSLRTKEFGVRLALGSNRGALLALVLARGLFPVVVGVTLGLLSAAAASQAIASLLYETKGLDPASVSVSIAILFVGASFAAFLPAYRAARVDPIRALRQD